MDVLFLGTGAFDYGSRLKTDLADRFDRDVRRSSAVLLDGRVLVDAGDWILNELAIADVDCTRLTDIFFSHSHEDHFRLDHLRTLAQRAGHPLNVWCGEFVAGLIGTKAGLCVHTVHFGEPVQTQSFTVTPLFSNHLSDYPEEQTFHYLFEKDGKKLFYGYDGAWLPTRTAKFLYGKKVDAYLADATCGDYENDYRIFEHNTIPMLRVMMKVLREQGALSPDCRIYLTHLAPSLHASHEDTVQLVQKDGFLVAFDGLRFTL